jgi:hypothetical protein
MKLFNRRLAICVFLLIAAYNATVLILAALLPTTSSSWLMTPWWAVNFEGLPFFHLLARHVPKGWPVACLLISIGVFSAFLWSTIAGYLFRRRHTE